MRIIANGRWWTIVLTVSAVVDPLYGQKLVPREVLFGNPTRESPLLSPDGTKLAYMAPDENGVLNVWLKTVGKEDDALLSAENHRGVAFYRWAEDGNCLLYEQDSDGDENWHLYAVDLKSRQTRDLTPFPGVKASSLLTDPRHPGELLIGLNRRNPRSYDMYRVSLETASLTLDTENPGDVLSWTADPDFVIRAATAFDPRTGDTILRVRDAPNRPWRNLIVWPFEQSVIFGQINDGSVIADFSADGTSLYVVSSLHSDKSQLVRVDTQSGKELELIAQDLQSDVAEDPDAFPDNQRPLVLMDRLKHVVQAVGFEYLRWEWKITDASIAMDWKLLESKYPGFLRIVSRDNLDTKWIVAQVVDDGPQRFYLYDRKTKTAQLLFADQPKLLNYRLAKMKSVVIKSRDGLELVGYLTLPRNLPPKQLSMILYPHGGPWARDSWGYDRVPQFLANRGYAVLQVNFRGSTGFGKSFLNAGNHQWGLAMQDDLTDGVKWAIDQGIADPKRIAALGYSGGGYEVLRGITRTPELYACGVDIVGPTDLNTLLSSMPPWWEAVKSRWIRRIGDVEHDGDFNRLISPLYAAEQIHAPLLIGQGENDPRVNIKNSDMMVAALRKRNIPVTYVVYPDEGHGFNRPENNLDFFGRVEVFLAQCLGGRSQPWKAVRGSTPQLH